MESSHASAVVLPLVKWQPDRQAGLVEKNYTAVLRMFWFGEYRCAWDIIHIYSRNNP
jgi:hypothetical protein